MRYWVSLTVILIALYFGGPWITLHVPSEYNPFIPLAITDPPNLITRYKLRKLDNNPRECLATLERAQKESAIQFSTPGDMGGKCPLTEPVRV